MTGSTRQTLTLRGETLELLPERAVFWPARKTLIVADLHWGKTETFHRRGIPIPGSLIEDDLQRLGHAIAETGAERLLVLGDLIHTLAGLTPSLLKRIGRWRREYPVRMVVIRGNHDRHLKELPPELDLELLDDILQEGPFAFSHEPEAVDGAYTWAGHLHPTFVMGGRSDSMRLPCFYLGREYGILPAFSAFTGGIVVQPESDERIFLVADDRILEW